MIAAERDVDRDKLTNCTTRPLTNNHIQEKRVSVRIRMKQFGRKHRPYYRICAMDIRRPRDGRVLEQLGTYDPLVPETDARAVLNGERIAYWLSVGAQPSDKVRVLIKKYGAGGTHVAAQQAALGPAGAEPPPARAAAADAQGRKAGQAGRGRSGKTGQGPPQAGRRASLPKTADRSRPSKRRKHQKRPPPKKQS